MRATPAKRGRLMRQHACALGALLALSSGVASAVSLPQAYQAALKHDPAFRMSYFEYQASREYRVLGRAGLLPNVSASFAGSKVNAEQTNPTPFRPGEFTTTHPNYVSRSSIVQLRQPLFNMEAVTRYRQGKVQTEQGEAVYEASINDVALRVVRAYFDALFAQDQVSLARVQREMYAEQQKVNERLFEKGEGTRTDMLETKARLDLAEAVLLEAEDNATVLRNALAGVIGMEPGTLDSLSDDFRVGDRILGSFDEWQARVLKDNPELEAARLAVENARLEIVRNRAAHLPRVDFVASYGKNAGETLNTYQTDSINRALGVQVNIPLYAGGAVNAQTRQAVAGYERAQADLELRTSKIMIDLRKAYSQVESSVRRVDALVKAVESNKLLLTATEQSIKGGVRINLDLLNAQERLFTSQRDLAQARYTYLLSLLQLQAATGVIAESDIRQIAAYLRR